MQNRILVLVFVALVFILGALLYIYNPNPEEYGDTKGSGSGGVVCAQDAKMCPDGSYVGRTGPNCEFARCPIPEGTMMEDGTNSANVPRGEEGTTTPQLQ